MTNSVISLGNIFRQRSFQAAFLVIFNSFSWYFPLFVLFTNSIENLNLSNTNWILVFGFHYLTVAGSAFLGNRLSEKLGRNRLIQIWIVLGVLASLLLLSISTSNLAGVYGCSILLGSSLGLGFPSALSYFGDNSPNEKKGLVGGVTFALTFVAITLVGVLSSITSLEVAAVGFALWRIFGLISFQALKTERHNVQTKVPYLSIIRERPFLLYFLPWTIFCVVNFFQAPFFDTQLQKLYNLGDLSYIISISEFGIGGISMLIGGYLSDRIGRKRLIITGFALIGIGYALLSFASQSVFVFYAYVLLDGIAWGIFFLMFLLVIWSDLAQSRTKDRYYLLGNMPFILSSYLSIIMARFSGLENIQFFIAFSFASFFLFVAVIPLMIAPETLPEKVMRDQDLRNYAEKALRQAEKVTKKTKDEEVSKETDSQEKSDEETRKIAEQYY